MAGTEKLSALTPRDTQEGMLAATASARVIETAKVHRLRVHRAVHDAAPADAAALRRALAAAELKFAAALRQIERMRRRDSQREREAVSLKAAVLKAQRFAYEDELTGLPNRHALLDHFNLAAALAARSGEHVALLFIDLDGFKQVNDTFGHSFEDKLLRQVALRLVGCVQASDTTCRYGGDEFAVLCRFGVGIGPRAVSRQGSSRDRRGGMPLFRRREGKVRVRGPAARAGRRTSRPQ